MIHRLACPAGRLNLAMLGSLSIIVAQHMYADASVSVHGD
jgi:hypothetical protein